MSQASFAVAAPIKRVEVLCIILSLCILLLCISLKARLLVLLIVVLLKVCLKMLNLQEMKKNVFKKYSHFQKYSSHF